MKRRIAVGLGLWAMGFIICASLTGCGPTYRKELFTESILKLCKDEYRLDVKVETAGKTIAIYLPLTDLIDLNFAISKSAGDKINDVILSVSRVALSSDAGFEFYCIIAHDVRIPEIQIVIIKSVDDVKRFLLNDISRNEYSKRMLIDIRMSPQAQKERSIKEVLERMAVDKRSQDLIMNDFFRSEPAALGDIGYWNDRFYVKDISMPEFLAEQMASRIRIEFREDKELASIFLLKSSKGHYVSKGDEGYFKLEIAAEQRGLLAIGGEAPSERIYKEAAKIAADVLHSYRFNSFGRVEIVDEAGDGALSISSEDLERYRTKKIKFEEILKK